MIIDTLGLSCAQLLSRVQLFATPWTVAHQAPLFVGLSRQECWSRLPCPPPGDLPDPGIKPGIAYTSCIGRHVLHHLSHQGSPWSVHPLPISRAMAHSRLPSGHHGALGVGGKASGTKSGWSKCGDLECTRQSRGWRSGMGRDPSCLLLRKNPERERSKQP